MNILPMTRQFLPQVAEIERLCFSSPWRLSSLEETFAQNTTVFYMAVDADTLLGYVSFQEVLGEGYINNVAVHPNHRRKSIASLLLKEMNHYGFQNLQFLTLEVRESNTPAIALYKKNGYQSVAQRKNYYDHPKENAVIMTRYFQNE